MNELKNIKKLHVILSHMHHDHTAGFTWLLRLWPGILDLYVPTKPLVEFDGMEAIKTLTNLPFFGLSIEEWPNCNQVYTIDEEELVIDDLEIKLISQEHSV